MTIVGLYTKMELFDCDVGRFTIGKHWMSDEIEMVKMKDHLIEIKWEKHQFILNASDDIKYWCDGLTGCEYTTFDRCSTIDNSYLLEYAKGILSELINKVTENGLCARTKNKRAV